MARMIMHNGTLVTAAFLPMLYDIENANLLDRTTCENLEDALDDTYGKFVIDDEGETCMTAIHEREHLRVKIWERW